MLGSDSPKVMLWPLINTWTLAAIVLPGDKQLSWERACKQLGLNKEDLPKRVEGLDHYLDEIEILLDEIAEANGLETSTTI